MLVARLSYCGSRTERLCAVLVWIRRSIESLAIGSTQRRTLLALFPAHLDPRLVFLSETQQRLLCYAIWDSRGLTHPAGELSRHRIGSSDDLVLKIPTYHRYGCATILFWFDWSARRWRIGVICLAGIAGCSDCFDNSAVPPIAFSASL